MDSKVYCLSAADGLKVWEFKTGGSVSSSPAVSGEYVYVGNDENKIYCLNTGNGEKVWSFQTEDFVESSPAVSEGYVYVGSLDDKVYCLNAAKEDVGSWPMFRYNPQRTGAK
jgi:outer membrane protein assembly factor BamB